MHSSIQRHAHPSHPAQQRRHSLHSRNSSDDEPGSQPIIKKKQKRVLRACDQCRRRKIRCDSATMPEGVCSNCISFDLQCTQIEPAKKRGPKGQSQALQQRVDDLEALLRRLHPDIDLEEELNSISANTGEQSRSPSVRPPPHNSLLPGPSLIVTGNSEESGNSDTEDVLAQTLSGLQIDCDQDRFFGQSSGFMFMRQALGIKKGVTKEPSELVTDSGTWQVHPWELELETHEQFPEYSFPEEDLMRELITLFFRCTHPMIPFIHGPTFKRNFDSGLHRRNGFFASLVLMMCALSSRYSDDPRVHTDGYGPQSSGWKWFRQVSIIRKSLLKTACLFELQFYTLAAMYVQGTSSPQTVWTLAGIGLRFAQERGVHRRKPPGHKWTIEDEEWKRCFWALLHFDRLICSFVGRPCSIHVEDFDVELPFECDDEYWENEDPSKVFVQPARKPSYVSYFIWTIKLGDILAHALRTIYSVNKYRTSLKRHNEQWETDIVGVLDGALNKWTDEVPAHLRWDPDKSNDLFFRQSAALYAHYYYVVIQVHRPFIPSVLKKFSTSSLVTCANAARSVCRIVDVMTKRAPIFHPQIQMAVYTAAIVILINLYGARIEAAQPLLMLDPASELADVDSCLEYLGWCDQRWHIAGRFKAMIQHLASVSDTSILKPPFRLKRSCPDDDMAQSEQSLSPSEQPDRPIATNSRVSSKSSPLSRPASIRSFHGDPQRLPVDSNLRESTGYSQQEGLPRISHHRDSSLSAALPTSGSLSGTTLPFTNNSYPSQPLLEDRSYVSPSSNGVALLSETALQGAQYQATSQAGYENTMGLWSNAPVHFGMQDWGSYISNVSNGAWNRDNNQAQYSNWA